MDSQNSVFIKRSQLIIWDLKKGDTSILQMLKLKQARLIGTAIEMARKVQALGELMFEDLHDQLLRHGVLLF